MVCIACGLPARCLCSSCTRSLRPSPRRLVDGVLTSAPFAHTGAAAVLVRNLKYRRSIASARFLAGAMAELVPGDAACLVPVPRAPLRRLKHGIDPAAALAAEVGRMTGLPVIRALAPPLWWPSHAGRDREHRAVVPFRTVRGVPAHAVLIDDVVTSGVTVTGAIRALEVSKISVVSATSAGTMEQGANSFPAQGGGVARKRQSVLGSLLAAQSSTASVPRDVDATSRGDVPFRPREEYG